MPSDSYERFGPLGYQTCEDTGALTIERMKTVDRDFLDRTKQFIANAVNSNQPFLTWFNSTRMHFYTHINDDVEGISGQGFYGDGMLEHDGHVGEMSVGQCLGIPTLFDPCLVGLGAFKQSIF